MKLVAPVKLLVDDVPKARLLATMAQVNTACSWLAERAFELKLADKIQLQKLYYRDLRGRFGLSLCVMPDLEHGVRDLQSPQASGK